MMSIKTYVMITGITSFSDIPIFPLHFLEYTWVEILILFKILTSRWPCHLITFTNSALEKQINHNLYYTIADAVLFAISSECSYRSLMCHLQFVFFLFFFFEKKKGINGLMVTVTCRFLHLQNVTSVSLFQYITDLGKQLWLMFFM